MKLLYNIGIVLYGLIVRIVALFNHKAKLRYHGGRDAIPYLKKHIQFNANYIWVHAASLGEFEQGRPIIERIRQEYPHYQILLTFFSPSGYTVRHDYQGADLVCYLPLDTPRNARKFVKMVQPKMAFFVKYEFWANLLGELSKREIPTYLFSAIFREKQVFFRWYGVFFLNLLSKFNRLFVQDQDSLELLKAHGVTHVEVAGDTRFDRVMQIANAAKRLPIAESFSEKAKVLVAGSTWQPDDVLLIHYMNAHPDYKLIIASHEIGEDRIQFICDQLKMPMVRYTQATEENVKEARCLVVDCIGILSSLYQYATVSYIGGGFGVGIHNTLEAAVWKVPVVFGPNYQRFKEARELIACGGAFSIETQEEINERLDTLFVETKAGEAAGAYVASRQGATDILMKYVF